MVMCTCGIIRGQCHNGGGKTSPYHHRGRVSFLLVLMPAEALPLATKHQAFEWSRQRAIQR